MPILTDDIKLLKSAVMADTTDGGGAMTGVAVVDGQSNNLFPDTSEVDRANGRVQFRKVFGVAHTSDVDTLMGANCVLLDAPDDPLVHCALLKTPGWADTRNTAKEVVERYVLKGPRVAARLYDTHYAGSVQVRLISFVPTNFPAGGEAIVLRNPNGVEQYVRVLRAALSTQQIAVTEGSSVLVLTAFIATCDIGQPLQVDFAGPPAQRVVNEAGYAQVFSSNASTGAKFYGIKPLAVAGAPGDYQVRVSGGIYTPIVPAATVESPIIDQFPLQGRAALVKTGMSSIAMPAATFLVGPNTIISTPTPIEPGSVSLAAGASFVFTDDSQGNLQLGTLTVGTVDYKGKTITFLSGAANYGTASNTLTYKPASTAGASAYSAALTITLGNQGLAFTNVFEPPPAPGSFTLSYMAQGRWYTLVDNLNGKLAGADSSYGVGTINYATGSMMVTLGAMPDVGSPLLADWGDPTAATAVVAGYLPARVGARIPLNSRTKADEITIAWSRGGTPYTASTNAAGVLTGAATGAYADGVLTFEPNIFPDVNVTLTTKLAATGGQSAMTVNGGGSYTLTGTLPVTPGSFRASVLVNYPSTVMPAHVASPLPIWDAEGVLYLRWTSAHGEGQTVAVGTINYATGAVTVNASANLTLQNRTTVNVVGWQGGGSVHSSPLAVTSVGLQSPITAVSYAAGATTTDVQSIAAGPWTVGVITNGPPMLVDGTMFKLGADLYTAVAGVLRRGWNVATGSPAGGAAGAVSSDGRITVSELPSNFTNGLTWYNAAQDVSAKAVSAGVFRTASAPLKTGIYQMQVGAAVGVGNDAGVISGGGFSGTADYQRGVVLWASAAPIDPASLSYNAVFLQYLPLDGALLGLETARLPLDGKVPIFRAGDLVVVHNTQTLTLPNALVKDHAYDMGRVRIAAVKVKDALGALVPDTKYIADLDAGTIKIPAAADITMYTQPLAVAHRIEDMVRCISADISGVLKLERSLTHGFPAPSFASSTLVIGDVFARAYNYFEQGTWTGVWSDTPIGAPITANFNEVNFPPVMTNRGAITERWAAIFTNTTTFRIVGESVGEIGVGNTGADCAPINPATGVPYCVLPSAAWGNGWSTGNVFRWNTAACGAPFWVTRTILQGPASQQSDQFTLAFRGDVDRP